MRLVILFLSCAFAASALADPRPIDMTTVLMGPDGVPLKDGAMGAADDPTCSRCGPLTLGRVVATALLTDRKDETGLSTLDKAKRGALALRLLDDKAAVLTSAQITEIVRLLNLWAPVVVARALPLLDPNLDLTK